MPWPTLPTFTTGNVLTAAQLSTLEDALNFLHAPPACKVGRSAFSVASGGTAPSAGGAGTPVDCTTETFDTDTMHSNATNPSRVTTTTAGKYVILGQCAWSLDNNGRREMAIFRNGSILTYSTGSPVDGGHVDFAVDEGFACSAGDYIELVAWQNSGSTLTVSVGLNVFWVSN